MSILDDAIREHLELKRAHGADEAEVKKLEDEAFGPPGRPEETDPFAEAPTQFMTTEALEAAEPAEEGDGPRRINVADLQEPPPPETAEQREESRVEAVPSVEPEGDAPPLAPAEDLAQAAPPAEEQTAMEHEIVTEPAEPASAPEPDEERRAIAEQPTELFDVEAEMGGEAAPAEAPSPSDEQIVEAEREEPRLVPAADDDEDEEDEEFWSEQRLSDELDQALESPLTEEHELPPPTEKHEAPKGGTDPAALYEDADTEGEDSDEHEAAQADFDPDTGHEDVLEDTPEFLEESPEDDELWFEQKPPKDFDFDD